MKAMAVSTHISRQKPIRPGKGRMASTFSQVRQE
jgi:hypothetical protein